MNMTREEASGRIRDHMRHHFKLGEALNMELAALRPVSREQVEKVFSGCSACKDHRCVSCSWFGWHPKVCRQCENQSNYRPSKFCPHCGKPLTDEAVQMVMERLEALYGQENS